MAKLLSRSRTLRFRDHSRREATARPSDVNSSNHSNTRPSTAINGHTFFGGSQEPAIDGQPQHNSVATEQSAPHSTVPYGQAHTSGQGPSSTNPADDGIGRREDAIGLALCGGEQAVGPTKARGQPQAFPPSNSITTSITSRNVSADPAASIGSTPKLKPRVWKSIGSIFRKKAVAQPAPVTAGPISKAESPKSIVSQDLGTHKSDQVDTNLSHLEHMQGAELMLDVAIPSVEMERYSVMFGTVLRNNRQSSLLERRQASIEPVETKKRLPADQSAHTKSRRRVSSPSHPAPSFTLFPSPCTYDRQHSQHTRPQLRRSHTTNSILSPIRSKEHPLAHFPVASPPSPNWSDDTVTVSATPSTSCCSGTDWPNPSSPIRAKLIVRPSQDPVWQMVTKSGNPLPPAPLARDLSFGVRGRSIKQKDAVEVSVARSVPIRSTKKRIRCNQTSIKHTDSLAAKP